MLEKLAAKQRQKLIDVLSSALKNPNKRRRDDNYRPRQVDYNHNDRYHPDSGNEQHGHHDGAYDRRDWRQSLLLH